MQLADWLRIKNVSIKAFSEKVRVERTMIYRYFSGSVPRARTIQRIEELTAGAVTAQDFYLNAMSLERAQLGGKADALKDMRAN
jgi:transcriptional regulator with XRE-family HTH domain